MLRQITVYERYDNLSLKRRIWNKMRDDYYQVYRKENPNSGRSSYKKFIVMTLSDFANVSAFNENEKGQFYLDSGEFYDPFLDDVRSKTIENFLGKKGDCKPQSNPADKSLRFFHAYLLVKYPKIEHSLRMNDYAYEYIKMLEAKYLSWKRSDVSVLTRIRIFSERLCGTYTNVCLEHWPTRQIDSHAPENKAARSRFGGAYRMLILSMLKSEPILLAHYLAFDENDVARLQQGNIENLEIGRASGAAVPSVVGLSSDQYLIRFDLMMSNRNQNDIPFYFPLTVEEGEYTQEKYHIHGFTTGAFDYAPRSCFVRTTRFNIAGQKLFDLYGVDI